MIFKDDEFKDEESKDNEGKDENDIENNLPDSDSHEEYVPNLNNEDSVVISEKNNKKVNSDNRKLFTGVLLTVLVLALSILIATLVIAFSKDLIGLGGSEKSVFVDIPRGSNTSEISKILKKKGIIDYPVFFRMYSKMHKVDGSYKSGQHILKDSMPYNELINQLKSSPYSTDKTVKLTFKEGITINQVATMLKQNNVCDDKEFLAEFNKVGTEFDFEKLIPDNSLRYNKMEGYLFPDTYDFYLNSDPILVVQRLRQVFTQKVYSKYLTAISKSGMSFDEVITLASMVQAEAPNYADMQKVASVFLNRLKNNKEFPKLESDPTKKYVMSTIRPNLEKNNEEMCNAYNTYEGQGLPPGAICNPGEDAIKAVLNPASTDYYYFCANINTKQIYYAKTHAQHEQNLVKANLK